jgi:tRNA(Ile)-lysidine synthase
VSSQFLQRLQNAWPPNDWHDVTVAVAVSGGADSVSLLCGLAELREDPSASAAGKLVVLHFNHKLRSAADDDEHFVRALAARLKLPCEVGHAADRAIRMEGNPDGLEAAAREVRYAFLLQTAERLGARYVATAHTADDQAETILHRILRGTGLAGLAGIPRIRALSPAVTLIRPLLDFNRSEVVQYLSDRQQNYRLDESNEDPSFTRNRIRHALLPQLAAQYNPSVREALLRLGKQAGDAQQVLESQAQQLTSRCADFESEREVTLDCDQLQSVPIHLLRELLVQIWKHQRWPQQQMGFAELDALAALLLNPDSGPTSLNLPGNIRATKQADQLKLTRL